MSKEIKQQRMNARDEASQLFCWCIVTAMNQKEGIGAERLRRACNEMQAFQARYKSKIDSGNRRTATEAMRDDLREICDLRYVCRKIELRVITGKSNFAWRRMRALRSHGWLWPRRRI